MSKYTYCIYNIYVYIYIYLSIYLSMYLPIYLYIYILMLFSYISIHFLSSLVYVFNESIFKDQKSCRQG